MPVPVYSAGSPGNVINGISVAKSANAVAFLDLSAEFEGQLSCQVDTLTATPTAGTTFSAYKVYGNKTTNTLSSTVNAGATSIAVASATAIHPNQRIALIAASTGVGEIVTVTAAPTGTGPYTIAISGTINAYASGDHVYLIAQSTTHAIAPMPQTPAASTDYSAPMTLGTGQWIIAAANADTAEAVTVTISLDSVTAYQ